MPDVWRSYVKPLEVDAPSSAQFHLQFSGICSIMEFCYITPENNLIFTISPADLTSHFQYICPQKVARKGSPLNAYQESNI